jgi:hypothetical protein
MRLVRRCAKENDMPSMPVPRRQPPPTQPPREPPPQDDDQQEGAADGSPDESYLSFGGQAKEHVKTYQEANAFRGYREFFITKTEMQKAKEKNEQGVTARVHFIRNYANPKETVAVPRCTIMLNGRPTSFTSAGNDCALAAAGVPVSMRPVYLLIDHRQYKKQDNTVACDDLKLFIPPPAVMGIMENAVKNLAENLGVDPSQVDITKHEAKLTKVASGRSTTWAIDFVIAPKALSKTATDNIAKAFGELGYQKTLLKWMAPNPKYRISKGGTYRLPPKQGSAHGSEDDESPPY